MLKKVISYISEGYITKITTPREIVYIQLSITINVLILFCAGIWAILYYSIGLQVAAFAPLGYLVGSIITLIITRAVKNYAVMIQIHLGLILVLPFVMHLILRVSYNAGLVILWSMLAPLQAIFLTNKKSVKLVWLFAFIILLVTIDFFYIKAINYSIDLPFTINIFMNFFGMGIVMVFLLVASKKLTTSYQQQLENILFDIFPEPVAKQIGRRVVAGHKNYFYEAQQYDDVAIIFIKFIFDENNSVKLTNTNAHILHAFFRKVNTLARILDIHRIKTIGECYLGESGMFQKTNLFSITELANQILIFVEKYNQKNGTNIAVKIGIDMGRVVGGIIGKTKMIYDVWGDTVNTASRVSNTKYTNMVIITKKVKDRVQDQYVIQKMEKITLKGKGEMQLYGIEKRSGINK